MQDLRLTFKTHGRLDERTVKMLELATKLNYLTSCQIEARGTDSLYDGRVVSQGCFEYAILFSDGESMMQIMKNGLGDVLRADKRVQSALDAPHDDVVELANDLFG